jgi:hypothetical protein
MFKLSMGWYAEMEPPMGNSCEGWSPQDVISALIKRAFFLSLPCEDKIRR